MKHVTCQRYCQFHVCLFVIIPRYCFDMSYRYVAACELWNVMVILDQIHRLSVCKYAYVLPNIGRFDAIEE